MTAQRKYTLYLCEQAIHIVMNDSDSAGSAIEIDLEDDLGDFSNNFAE